MADFWYELDHHSQPIHRAEVDMLQDAAERGHLRSWSEPRPFVALLKDELTELHEASIPIITPTIFIGYTIGVRAGLLGLDVDHHDASGFRLTTKASIQDVREGKIAGTRAAELAPEMPFEDMMGELLQITGRGDTSIQRPEHLIGRAIGVRNFQLGAMV